MSRRRRKPPSKGGRPCKFTDLSVLVPLVAAMARGALPEHAARVAGIGQSTFYRWVALARAGDPRFAALAPLIERRLYPAARGHFWKSVFR